MNKIKTYLRWKPSIFISIILLMIPIFLYMIKLFKLDNDFWFLINLGRNIINNGFIKVDTFTMHGNLNFIPQQWLTDIIFYTIYNKFNIIGIYILMMSLNIIIIYLIYRISYLISNKIKLSLLISVFAAMFLLISFSVTRPFIFDMVLFLLELFLLELYFKNNNIKYLIYLPIISILLINIHSSMWLMFFVLMLPYIVELLFNRDFKSIKYFLFMIVISIILGFINPYSYHAILYLFNSYGISYINSFILEMQPLTIKDSIISFIFIFVVLLSFYYNKGHNKIRLFFLFMGTLYLALSHYRGIMFFMFSFIICLSYNFKDCYEENLIIKNKKIDYICYIIIIILFLGLGIYSIRMEKEEKLDLYHIASFLDKEKDIYDKDVYTSYEDGSYLEYRGFKCYIDPRAEVFLKKNNKKEDYMKEYYDLQKGKLNYNTFLNKYNFDYLVINETKDILRNYLDKDYKNIFSYGNYIIYKKVID